MEIRPKGITLQKFEAIHNKDYSVVKTFKVAEFRRLFFPIKIEKIGGRQVPAN